MIPLDTELKRSVLRRDRPRRPLHEAQYFPQINCLQPCLLWHSLRLGTSRQATKQAGDEDHRSQTSQRAPKRHRGCSPESCRFIPPVFCRHICLSPRLHDEDTSSATCKIHTTLCLRPSRSAGNHGTCGARLFERMRNVSIRNSPLFTDSLLFTLLGTPQGQSAEGQP